MISQIEQTRSRIQSATNLDQSVKLFQEIIEEYERWLRSLDNQVRTLERERQKLSAVVNYTDAGFLVFNSSLQVLWTNEIFIRYFHSRCAPGSLLRSKCNRVLCGCDDICDTCPALQAFTAQSVSHHEMCLNIAGATRHLYATAMPIRSLDGRTEEVILMLQDVTDLKVLRESQQALKASEDRYRRFFEENLAGDYISTPDGRLIACNPAFARTFGFASVEEAMSHGLASLYPNSEIRATFLNLLRSHRRLEYYEEELRRKDGSPVYVILNAVGTFDERGELIEIRGYLLDDTERRKVEGQFRQSQKMEAIGRLAGGVAHDFNNLLTAILGYSQLMLRRLPESDPMRKDAEEIEKAGERARSLTNQLLAFSRQQVLQPRVIDLNDVINENALMLGRIIGEDIEFVTRLDPAAGRVKVDPGQIVQVVMNLMVNARDAMPRGGKLIIETANVDLDEDYARNHAAVQPGPYIMLAVSDSGCGMDKDTLSHIFEPFFTTKEPGKGTGLGLSTVYGIVKQSGGHIWVYSELGQGATFKIYLPIVEETISREREEVTRAETAEGSETILLVEDEEAVRNLARRILEMNGYTVLEARHGKEALQIYKQHGGEIHLVVTDVVMPEMGGCELMGCLSLLSPETRVLYMSGYTDNMAIIHGIFEPGVAFLSKPFTPGALTRKVREVLDTRCNAGPHSQTLPE